MSASNFNYVCSHCRTATRHLKSATQAPKCLSCGEEYFCLGYKVEIPKHADAKSWLSLQKECQRRMLELQERSIPLRVRRKHFLEREIPRLKALTDNWDRNRQIKELESELANFSDFQTNCG